MSRLLSALRQLDIDGISRIGPETTDQGDPHDITLTINVESTALPIGLLAPDRVAEQPVDATAQDKVQIASKDANDQPREAAGEQSTTPNLSDETSRLSPHKDLRRSAVLTEFERTVRINLRHEALGDQYRQIATCISTTFGPGVPASVMLADIDCTADAALTMGHIGQILAEDDIGNVLLVDASLADKHLTRQYELMEMEGFSELLENRASWQRFVFPTATERLEVLPGGKRVRFQMATTAPRFASLTDEIKRRYRFVLVDAGSALLPMAQTLTRYCDWSYLLLQLGRSTFDEAKRAVSKLRLAGGRLVGCVVTNTT